MASRLLMDFAEEDLDEFRQDFLTLIRMTIELDKEYGAADEEALYNLPVYKHYVGEFNKKYPELFVLFTESSVGFILRIFFRDEKDIKQVLLKVASKIEGFVSIGADTFHEGKGAGPVEMEAEFKRVKTKLYIHYAGHESVFLNYDKRQDMVEVVYDPKNLMNEDSPAYKLCAYYALRNGFKTELDLKTIAGKFSSTASGFSRIGLGPSR